MNCRPPAILLCVLAPFLLTCASTPLPAPYDLLVTNALLVDGTGAPARPVDLAVRAGRIAAVTDRGELSAANAVRVLDADGRIVAPGFIDVHSHAAPGLETPGLSAAEPLVAQGVTTVVVNPDGGGPVDLAAQRRRLLEHGLGVNVVQLVPHGSVRREVLGMEDVVPSAMQLQEMEGLVRRGMEEGAWGLSSGTFYAPGSYAGPDEIVALAAVAAEYGGIYTSHIRDESDYTVGVVAAVEEVIEVARRSGLPVVVTHVKALGPPVWGASAEIVARIEAARDEGLSVWADQYPYLASATQLGAALLPRWAQAGGREALAERLDDAPTRARILDAMAENLARRGGAGRIQFRRFEPDPSIEGRRLDAVAAERAGGPLEVALELIRAGDVGIVSHNMDPADVERLMRQPWTMTSSDGGLVPMGEGVPHPRNNGAFARKIEHFVLEEGVLSLEQAIHSMTGLPARVLGMEDRGLLVEGRVADLVVFDPGEVRAHATFTDPHRLATGMDHVFVAGEAVIERGDATGAVPGRVLRRPVRAAGDT